MMNMKKVIKVAVYARQKSQKEELMKKTTKECWEFQYFEEKENLRGTRPVKYALYQKLLKSKFDAVLVWDLNSWANSYDELIPEIYRFYQRDVLFITLKTSIDLTNELTFCQFQTIEAFAQFKNKLRSNKIKDKFFVDSEGITRVKKSKKPVGKRGKDRKKRKRSGYIKRMEAKR